MIVGGRSSRDERPRYRLIESWKEARIRELIEAQIWPQGRRGDEPIADEMIPEHQADGTV